MESRMERGEAMVAQGISTTTMLLFIDAVKYLLPRCSRGGRGIVEDMRYERRRAEACVD